ncbi:hypothetical protein B488_03080 [Liberibacter crescens BT-1]|uniref:Uncharacterized protein n=1 Tax=Liberibacter crescens (strain BT-1) TaxID=1215343 RepID=L0EV77_LIBCB|nr:hypothetical protein B488_03080 [Liberibacter crescens BT-1]
MAFIVEGLGSLLFFKISLRNFLLSIIAVMKEITGIKRLWVLRIKSSSWEE